MLRDWAPFVIKRNEAKHEEFLEEFFDTDKFDLLHEGTWHYRRNNAWS
jgi:hypothetical protein